MKEFTQNLKKGFTLIELLIVIAILAILAAAVVIVINPAEMLAQARDSQRINDLNTLKSALTVYLTQTNSAIDLGACTAGGRCTRATAGAGPFGALVACATVSTTNTVAGSGWIDVNFSGIPGGSPIPYLPIDPSNGDTYFYAYACTEGTANVFELDSKLESSKFTSKLTADGGNQAAWYEQGTDPGLDL